MQLQRARWSFITASTLLLAALATQQAAAQRRGRSDAPPAPVAEGPTAPVDDSGPPAPAPIEEDDVSAPVVPPADEASTPTVPKKPEESRRTANEPDDETGFVSIFDGKTLAGWTANENTGVWTVENGELIARGGPSHLLYTGPVADHRFQNFQFRCEVMTTPKSDAGVILHTKYQDAGVPAGLEVQINNTGPDPSKTGGLYHVADLTTSKASDGEWFKLEILVIGRRVVVRIDDQIAATDWQPRTPIRKPEEVKNVLSLEGGTIALQAPGAGGEVRFRNMRIQPRPDYGVRLATPAAGMIAADFINLGHVPTPPGQPPQEIMPSVTDFSMNVRLPDFGSGKGYKAGLVFWGNRSGEVNDYYVLLLNDSGAAGVDQWVRGQKSESVPLHILKGLTPTPGGWIELRAVLQNQWATLYAGGVKVGQIRRSDSAGGRFGHFVGGSARPATIDFANFDMESVTAPMPVGNDADSFNDFIFRQTPDELESWSKASDIFGVQDDAMFIKPPPDKRNLFLYTTQRGDLMTISGRIRFKQGAEKKDNVAGFAYWAADVENYHSFELENSRQYILWQRVRGQTVGMRKATIPPAAKVNLNDWTAVHMVVMGQNATITLNGVPVANTVNSRPVKNAYFGIVAQSGEAPLIVEYKDVVVKRFVDDQRGRARAR